MTGFFYRDRWASSFNDIFHEQKYPKNFHSENGLAYIFVF